MERKKGFFEKVMGSPVVMWKGLAGLAFIGIALVLWFIPQIAKDIDRGTRNGFAAILVVYGLFRLATFFADYKNLPKDDERR